MGQINYLRKFIPSCAKLVQPITQLLSKEGSGVWTEECSQARNRVCDLLARRMALAIPRVGEAFELYVDADEVGMSAVLTQESDNK